MKYHVFCKTNGSKDTVIFCNNRERMPRDSSIFFGKN